jgi:hypothetical protein
MLPQTYIACVVTDNIAAYKSNLAAIVMCTIVGT